MSALKTIPRTAVDASLKVAKLPLDLVASRIGGNGAPVTAAEVAVDRLDATIRNVAGIVLRDDVLLEDADRRHLAADERAKARTLRDRAEQRGEQADETLAERERQAEQRREASAKQAERRREQAAKERKAREQRAAKAERTRKSAARKAKAGDSSRAQSEARKARLDALETKADALDEREEALTAADEAKRLGDAAAKAKAKRKS